ncbi:MAG: pirin family protein [Elusimicrobia bacterium]|nr:pirin family protein [Elusimicrobiota bacterium]
MKTQTDSNVSIRRAKDRFHTRMDWLDSWHSFSFGSHYSPDNTHHGLLLVSNDDIILPGTGFMTHPHQDMEIVTWVLEGEIEHRDSEGNQGVITPGLAQRISAGTGIWHSEMNPSSTKPVRLIQMWVPPDTRKIQPSYEQLDISRDLAGGGLVPVASGNPKGAIAIRQKGATLWAARLSPGKGVLVPEAKFSHLFVAKGEVHLENAGTLAQGDSVRLMDMDQQKVVGGVPGAEILIWETGRWG